MGNDFEDLIKSMEGGGFGNVEDYDLSDKPAVEEPVEAAPEPVEPPPVEALEEPEHVPEQHVDAPVEPGLRNENDELRRELEMMRMQMQQSQQYQQQQQMLQQQAIMNQQPVAPPKPFFEEADGQQLFDKPAEVMNRFGEKMVQTMLDRLEMTGRQRMAQQQHDAARYQNLVGTFYKMYPDLEQNKDLVEVAARDVAGRNPGVAPEQLLQEVGSVARERLTAYKERFGGANGPAKAKSKPNFGETSAPREARQKLTKQETHMLDVMRGE